MPTHLALLNGMGERPTSVSSVADKALEPTPKKITVGDLMRAQEDPNDPLLQAAREQMAAAGRQVAEAVVKPLAVSELSGLRFPEAPAVVTARRLRETNELLAQMVDIAQADATEARAEASRADHRTWWALFAAWVAVAVTVAVGIVQIWVATAGGG